MTAKVVASLVEGAIPVAAGLYCSLLGLGVAGKKPRSHPAWDDWRRRHGNKLKILGPVVMAFGLLQMAPAFEVLLRPSFWSTGKSELVPMERGTQWTYRSGKAKLTLRVAAHERLGDEMSARIEASLDGRVAAFEHQRASEGALYQTGYNGSLMDPPMCLVRDPRSGSQEWEYRSRSGTIHAQYQMTVPSPVVVPAGTFANAVLVESEATDPGGASSRKTWYVPRVGMVKFILVKGGETKGLELERIEGAK